MANSFFNLLGPGTQQGDPDFHINSLPISIETYESPSMSALEGFHHIQPTLSLLANLLQQMVNYQGDRVHYPQANVIELDQSNREFLNTLLGEGEVSVIVQGEEFGREIHIQESIFCGIWRVQVFEQGVMRADNLEVCPIPAVVWQVAAANSQATVELPPVTTELMNGLSLAHEVLAHVGKLSDPVHVINLTLLPVSGEDRSYLHLLCGLGNVKIRTRGYGESLIESTRLRYVWNIRCLNGLKGVLLDTYEICRIPDMAVAALEDIQDSRQRLHDAWCWLKEAHEKEKSGEV